MIRDTNKKRVYDAEQSTRILCAKAGGRGSHLSAGDVTFSDIAEAQHFLDKLVRPKFETAAERKATPITVFALPKKGKRNRIGVYYSQPHRLLDVTVPAIGLKPGQGMTALVLTHEYAHHLSHPMEGIIPGHGSEFARTYLDVVERIYTGHDLNGEVPAELKAQYDKHAVIYEPGTQRDAARRQMLRLRSDVLLEDEGARVIPITCVVYATKPHDFEGASYRTIDGVNLSLGSTHTDELVFGRGKSAVRISPQQLRYFDAPMVRVR